MPTDTCRFGILSTGNIAHRFAHDLALMNDVEIAAVGSRNLSSAQAYAQELSVPRAYGSYEEVAADPDVDIVYIGTPHVFHKENTVMCLKAGKPVLCEKAFAMNAAEAGAMIDMARDKGAFLMEAMWSRFFPVWVKVRELLAEGRIGEVRSIDADFGFAANPDPESRVFKRELGGGALLDIGIYPVSLALMVFGREPDGIASVVDMGTTGVDEEEGIVLDFGDGRHAVINCSLRVNMETAAAIYGTKGYIRIPRKFFKPERLVVGNYDDESQEEFVFDLDGYGFTYEVREVMRCLHEGALESSIMSHADSRAALRTLDRIRAQWGLTYPGE